MSHLRSRRSRLAMMLLLLLVGMLVFTQSAYAQAVARGDTIPEGTVFDSDAFLSGSEVVMEGTVKGDVLAVGGTITIEGTVEGSLVMFGGTAIINGQVDGSVYSAVLNLQLGDDASIGRSLYFIGSSIVSDPESQVGRDLVAVGLGSQLTGAVGRDVKTVIGLQLFQLILGQADEQTGQLIPDGEAALPGSGRLGDIASAKTTIGTQIANYDGPVDLLLDLQRGKVRSFQEEEEPEKQRSEFGDWAIRRIRQFITFLIVGGLVAWLIPTRLSAWSEGLRKSPFASGGYGIVVFISGFVGAVLLFILVLAEGFFIRYLTLRLLSLAFWGLSLSSLWLAFSIFMVFVVFISKIVVSYLVGLLILGRLIPKAAGRRIWPLLLGLIIYVLLTGIPLLGFAVGLISIF